MDLIEEHTDIDIPVEFGGGFASDEPFLNVLDLLADPSGDKLNLQIPYLDVNLTPLWHIPLENPFEGDEIGESDEPIGAMQGLGVNQGATMTIPAYVFNLFGSLMEQVQGYIDDFIYGFLKPKLEDAILNVLGNYENESRTLAQSIANNTLSDFDEGSIINLFDEIDSKVSTQADTDLSILGGKNLYNSLEEHVPINRIKNLVNSLRPITNVINKFGPILNILQFAAGGVTSIITKIVIEIVEDFLNSIKSEFFNSAIDIFLSNSLDYFNQLIIPLIDLIEIDQSNNFEISELSADGLEEFSSFSGLSTFIGNIMEFATSVDVDLLATYLDNLKSNFTTFIQNVMGTDFISTIIEPFVSIYYGISDVFTSTNSNNQLRKTMNPLPDQSINTHDDHIISKIIIMAIDSFEAYLNFKIALDEDKGDDIDDQEDSNSQPLDNNPGARRVYEDLTKEFNSIKKSLIMFGAKFVSYHLEKDINNATDQNSDGLLYSKLSNPFYTLLISSTCLPPP